MFICYFILLILWKFTKLIIMHQIMMKFFEISKKKIEKYTILQVSNDRDRDITV